MRRVLVSLLVFVALGALPAQAEDAAQPWTAERFGAEFAGTYGVPRALALCREAAGSTEDPALLRVILERWKSVDPADAEAYFAERQTQQPDSPLAAVLRGLACREPVEGLRWARQAIELEPGNLGAYELLTGIYLRGLLRAQTPTPGLAEHFAEDREAFARFLSLSGESPQAQQAMENFLIYTGDAEGALALLERAKAAGARWATDQELARIQIYRGRYDEAKTLIAAGIDAMVQAGRLGAEERDEYVDYYYASGLREAKAYEVLLADQRAKATPGAPDLAARHYDVGCLEALLGRRDAAFTALRAAAAAGYADPKQLAEDPDLASLRADAAWAPLAEQVAGNLAAGRFARRTTALAAMIERPAPDWTLRTVAGDSLSLADLRGQVLVLDFWATWCGPCRMAMPVLDEWMKTKKPAGLRVFSVNVWEQTPAGAAAFIDRNGYAMELLYGDDALAKAYGVDGIPYICAIDKQGRIRFEEKGYSPELAEKLEFWAEALSAE